jgi:hypothetical protein
MRTGVFLFLLLMACTACKQEGPVVRAAFYHWKTEFAPDSRELAYLRENNIGRLYLKLFDVDKGPSGDPIPLASLVLPKAHSTSLHKIPAIFITNRSFEGLPETAAVDLANQVWQKVRAMTTIPDWAAPLTELQIDCDWTAGTRKNYFAFLRQLKKELSAEDILLSATIRLHQAKFPEQTGVPPVDRGMLMFYNIGEVTDPEEENSILNEAAARKYLTDYRDYPLKLDLALPIFHWGVLFREDRLIRLINNLEATDLADTTRFKNTAENRYAVKKSTYLEGHYLYQGDRIRLEAVSPARLRTISKLIREQFPPENFHLAFYHLDPETIKYYPNDTLQNILHIFQSR